MHPVPRRLWQIAGGLAIAHVVLILLGIYLQNGPLFSDGVQGIEDDYVGGDLARSFTGGIVASFGFLLLVVVLTFLAGALGRSNEAGRWAARTGLACGLAYVAVTFAVGFPAGGAAMYGAQHGLDVDTAFALNNVRIFSYFLSLLLLGGSTLGFAAAALADRVHTGWFGTFGLVSGVALLASTPLAGVGQQDWGTLVWAVWFVGVGVLMLRHREVVASTAVSPAPRETVGQD
ncbi:MAG: hypothetical protein AVDCRST_MAG34-1205 [uncultured Nocardioidaceae bacterium]|uniref:DUF4386 family protein n=1 Tax=uncultured Nocardioidaceae bacterium TaxID=253824 RepID=A0A6J4LZS3_9ACTN|nr:MAG: hypothetical protein AVDCRST_MAG34-1205 [uncultured Nocardioidaceae bacterium]